MADYYNGVLHYFLKKIQIDLPAMIPSDDVESIYSFNMMFCRMAEGHTRASNVYSSIQNAMNRWRKIEVAKGKHPCFNMVEHYSSANKELMPVCVACSVFLRMEEYAVTPHTLPCRDWILVQDKPLPHHI